MSATEADVTGPAAADRLRAAERLLPRDGVNPALDRIAELAVRVLRADTAQISLLTDVQYVPGGAGLIEPAPRPTSPADESICTITARQRAPLHIADARSDQRVAGLPPVTSGAVGSYLGVPLIADDSHVVGALCVYNSAPHDWTEFDVAILEQLATSVITELERSALVGEFEVGQVRWELAASAAGIGTFEWNPKSNQLNCDDRLIELFGFEPGRFKVRIKAFNDRLHPDDLRRAINVLESAALSGDRFESDFRIVLPSGGLRWITMRGHGMPDGSGQLRLLGTAFDTTAAHTGQERIERVLESMPTAFMAVDRDWRVTYINARGESMINRPRTAVLGADIWQLFPESVGTEIETVYRRALETSEPEILEVQYGLDKRWFEIRVWPVPEGLSLYISDVSNRRRLQDLRAMTVSASEQLAASLDIEATVRDLARLVVPELGDWSIVSLVGTDGTLQDLASWHVDPSLRPLVERYVATRLVDRDDHGPMGEAIRSGRPVTTTDVTDQARLSLRSSEALDVILELAPQTSMALPLIARGRVAGLLSVCRGADRPMFDADELAAASAIAERAGLALDTAQKFGEQQLVSRRLHDVNRALRQEAVHDRIISRKLQAAMLTRLPEPDHLHLVGRYLTANLTDQVGGDWYDAIMPASGATTLMIGDVMGHDITAATVMGQLRNMLRAFAWDRAEEAPAELIARLDRAMYELKVRTMATLAVVRIEQATADEAAGLRTLRWSNAGHPRPVLVTADGDARFIDGKPDPPLAVNRRRPRHDHVCSVPPGATLMLYTDGLTETRELNIDERYAQLLAAASAHNDLEPGAMLDAVIHDMVGDQPDDDVAVLAVRFHREDEPRPLEAGPERP